MPCHILHNLPDLISLISLSARPPELLCIIHPSYFTYWSDITYLSLSARPPELQYYDPRDLISPLPRGGPGVSRSRECVLRIPMRVVKGD